MSVPEVWPRSNRIQWQVGVKTAMVPESLHEVTSPDVPGSSPLTSHHLGLPGETLACLYPSCVFGPRPLLQATSHHHPPVFIPPQGLVQPAARVLSEPLKHLLSSLIQPCLPPTSLPLTPALPLLLANPFLPRSVLIVGLTSVSQPRGWFRDGHMVPIIQ